MCPEDYYRRENGPRRRIGPDGKLGRGTDSGPSPSQKHRHLRYNHYAIRVEDIEGTCSELVDRGLTIDGPVYVEATKRKLATIRDPNGILVQPAEIND